MNKLEINFEATDNACLECNSPHSNWRIVFFADQVGHPYWACSMHHASQIIDEWMNNQLDNLDNAKIQPLRNDDFYND